VRLVETATRRGSARSNIGRNWGLPRFASLTKFFSMMWKRTSGCAFSTGDILRIN